MYIKAKRDKNSYWNTDICVTVVFNCLEYNMMEIVTCNNPILLYMFYVGKHYDKVFAENLPFSQRKMLYSVRPNFKMFNSHTVLVWIVGQIWKLCKIDGSPM